MPFSEADHYFMRIALVQAEEALKMQFLRGADGCWQPMLDLFEKMRVEWRKDSR